MSYFLMLCSLLVVSEGFASNVPENYKYVPAKPGERPSCLKDGEIFCEHVDDYPEELILKLLKTAPPEYLELLSNESLPEFRNRSGVEGAEIITDQLCVVKRWNSYPRVMRDKNNEWRYIVNVKQILQHFPCEVCWTEGTDGCGKYINPTHRADIFGQCTQKYIITDALALHPSGEKLELVVPNGFSCCECTLYNKAAEKL